MRVWNEQARAWEPASDRRKRELQALVDAGNAHLEPIVGLPDEVACFVWNQEADRYDRARPTAKQQAAVPAAIHPQPPHAPPRATKPGTMVDGRPDNAEQAAETW